MSDDKKRITAHFSNYLEAMVAVELESFDGELSEAFENGEGPYRTDACPDRAG